MKKLAVLALLGLALALYGCSTSPTDQVTTTTSGNWEATLTGGVGPASQLNFVIGFTVTNTTGESGQGLDITSFSFINAGACFANGSGTVDPTGWATLTTLSTGQVQGDMGLTVPGSTGSVLTLLTGPDGFTGTSNGTPTTNGTLTDGVVVGTWTLTNSSDTSCTGSGNYIMCQGAATCTAP
jgi:hypothetical protein